MDTNCTNVVLIKLGALVIVVLSLQNLTDYLAYLSVGPDMLYVPIVAFGLNFLIPVAIAFALWRFPATLLGRNVPDEPAALQTSMSPEAVMLIGVSLIGLYTLIFGLIDLLYFETIRISQRQIAEDRTYLDYVASPQDIAGRITNVTQIAFGLLLIIGRRGIAAFLQRIRYAGTGAS